MRTSRVAAWEQAGWKTISLPFVGATGHEIVVVEWPSHSGHPVEPGVDVPVERRRPFKLGGTDVADLSGQE